MKLIELEPRWIGRALTSGHYETCIDPNGGHTEHWVSDIAGGLGLTFDCPTHRDHRLAVAFLNPIIPGTAVLEGQTHFWRRSGETFDDLTLTPSIDASKHGCWHGYITNGVVS